jgi:hypothetical protein
MVLVVYVACGGKAIIDGPAGDGGQGPGPGQGGATNTSTVVVTSTTTNQSIAVQTSVDGAGGSSMCFGCAAFLAGKVEDPEDLCPGSFDLVIALSECACNGVCAMACFEACEGSSKPSPGCFDCLEMGCSMEWQACLNDR